MPSPLRLVRQSGTGNDIGSMEVISTSGMYVSDAFEPPTDIMKYPKNSMTH